MELDIDAVWTQTVTGFSTNRTRRWATSLIKSIVYSSLRQTDTEVNFEQTACIIVIIIIIIIIRNDEFNGP